MIVISVIKAWLFYSDSWFFEVKLGFLSLFEKLILRKIWLRICNELFRECRLVINVRNAKTAYKSFKSKDLLFTVSNENWHLIQAPLIYLPPKCQPGTVGDLRWKPSSPCCNLCVHWSVQVPWLFRDLSLLGGVPLKAPTFWVTNVLEADLCAEWMCN